MLFFGLILGFDDIFQAPKTFAAIRDVESDHSDQRPIHLLGFVLKGYPCSGDGVSMIELNNSADTSPKSVSNNCTDLLNKFWNNENLFKSKVIDLTVLDLITNNNT